MNYSMPLPSLMELKSVKVPAVNGGTVDAYATVKGERTNIGTNVGGQVIKVGKNADKVEFVIHVEKGAVSGMQAGNVVLLNNQKENDINYFGFQATVSAATADGTVV